MNAFDRDLASTETTTSRWRRRPANRTAQFVVMVLFGVLGIYLAVSGYNRWEQVQPIAGGKTANGTVITVVQGQSCSRYSCTANWTPTVRFTAANGSTYTFIGPTGGQINVGDTVTVSYSPNNPDMAHDISGSGTNGLLMLGIGVFAAVLGVGLFVLGLEAVHRRTGLTSAREGKGWVGHVRIHSNAGAVAALAVLLALVVVGIVIL